MMIEKIFVVANKMGIHARPAAMFVQSLQRFASEIRVSKDSMEVNGKSVMGLMMLAAECGSKLKIKIWGHDENEAMKVIEGLFNNKFSED